MRGSTLLILYYPITVIRNVFINIAKVIAINEAIFKTWQMLWPVWIRFFLAHWRNLRFSSALSAAFYQNEAFVALLIIPLHLGSCFNCMKIRSWALSAWIMRISAWCVRVNDGIASFWVRALGEVKHLHIACEWFGLIRLLFINGGLGFLYLIATLWPPI
jgi:hypothetical protein